MSDEGRVVAGRYRISRRIGTGAMGAVWQAHDELLARTVAIKQLLLQPGLEEADAEEARQRTMREGRIAARLHHPNAITVFDVVTDDYGQPCLIMEYLESTSLAAVLQGNKTLQPLEVARIGEQIAAALKSAHRVGIVHRDIKPGNILLTADGLVKITDFGISRAKDDVSVTKTGMIAGTPAYLAPEVAIGQEPGPESDVFSLGSTLYAATEGQPPFGLSENTLSLLHAVAAGQINPPRNSGPLTSVLALLLHPEKDRRPTAEEAEELLAAVARGETPVGGPVEHDRTAMVSNDAAMAAGLLGGAAALDDGAEDADGRTQVAGHSGTLPGLTPATAALPGGEHTQAYPAAGYDGPATQIAPGAQQDDLDDGDIDDGAKRRTGWAKPAAAAALVLGGLAAAGIWMFSSTAEQTPANPGPAATTSTTSVAETTTTTTTTTTTAINTPTTTQRPAGPPPQTTTQPTTTTTTTSSSSSEPEPEPEPSESPEPPPTSSSPPPTSSEAPPTSSEPTAAGG